MTNSNYTELIARMNLFLKKSGLSKAGIARELGMNQPTVNSYFMLEGASQRDMPLSFLADLSHHFPQLDMDWLFRGESDHTSLQELREENERLKAQIAAYKRTIVGLSDIISDQNPK